jgi:hypothetical protein
MKMDKYLDRLVFSVSNGGPWGYVSLNEGKKGIVIEDVIEVTFNSLYPRLLLYLYDNGILNKFNIEVPNEVLSKLKYYYDNNLQSKNKLWIDSLWIKELRSITYQVFELFHQYMRMFYEDIIANIPYNWLYIDTDHMFFVGDEVLFNNLMKSVPFPIGCTVDFKPFVFFEAKKKYVISNSLFELKYKGLSHSKRKEEIVAIMKNNIRNKKLNDILR